MCLEEMLCCSIEAGALYYGETRRRQAVTFTPELRQTVREAERALTRLAPAGPAPLVEAAPELAERTAAVIAAYRELGAGA